MRIDDSQLFEMISGGDRRAFDTLTERYHAALCAFAARITGDHEAARDIVQEAFVRLWVARRNIARTSYGKTYLYAIVKNLSLSLLRSNARRRGTPHNEVADPIEEDITRYFIEQETFRMVAQAVERLPPRTAQVIRATLEGLRQDEIGRRMGITLATVKALKADGVKKLRTALTSNHSRGHSPLFD